MDRSSILSSLSQEGPSVILYLTVHPNAKKNRITKVTTKSIHVDIKAEPSGGKANDALLWFLSELLGLPIESLVLKKGHTSHKKVLLIKNSSLPDILRKMAPNL